MNGPKSHSSRSKDTPVPLYRPVHRDHPHPHPHIRIRTSASTHPHPHITVTFIHNGEIQLSTVKLRYTVFMFSIQSGGIIGRSLLFARGSTISPMDDDISIIKSSTTLAIKYSHRSTHH
jgi:hypothetical protein